MLETSINILCTHGSSPNLNNRCNGSHSATKSQSILHALRILVLLIALTRVYQSSIVILLKYVKICVLAYFSISPEDVGAKFSKNVVNVSGPFLQLLRFKPQLRRLHRSDYDPGTHLSLGDMHRKYLWSIYQQMAVHLVMSIFH